jgi:diketogulonate reductase-like aldo/keto reductase
MEKTLTLNNGVIIPRVGLGVFRAGPGEETRGAVEAALQAGYRHIDTARVYGNESDVGAAVKGSGIPRKEIFVTTKLWNDDQGYESALKAFDASLARLGLDYVDLYLLHWPVPHRRLESWRALEKLAGEGRVKAIGVSNFLRPHLEELLNKAKVVPAVDQIELTPFLQRREACAYCTQKGIAIEAYSPLTRGKRLKHPVIVEIAKTIKRTPAQILLRWNLQHGTVVLPKSTRRERIAENGDLFSFDLDSAAMNKLDALEENLVTGWDPAGQI